MSQKRLQLRSLRRSRPSVFGDGLPERLRSTSMALLGLTAAAGLALVGVVFHQGWTVVPDLPIPGAPVEREAVHDRRVVAGDAPPDSATEPRRAPDAGRRSAPAAPSGPPRGDSRLASADPVAASPPAAPVADPAQPGGAPPDPQPTSPAPVATPSPASNPVQTGNSPSTQSTVGGASEDSQDQQGSQGQQGGQNQGRQGGQNVTVGRDRGRSKGVSKSKAPPPTELQESPYAPPASADGDEPDPSEVAGIESQTGHEQDFDDDDDYDRDRGRGRR